MRLFAFILALFFASIPSISAAAPGIIVNQNTRIVLFGDSHVQDPHGVGTVLKDLLAQRGYRMEYVFDSGTSVRHWDANEQLSVLIGSMKPQVVVIVLGTNDAMVSHDPAKRQARFQKFVNKIATMSENGRTPTIVWTLPPELSKKSVPYLSEVRVAVKKLKNVVPINLAGFTLPLTGKGVHLTKEGYAEWAKIINACL